MASLRNRGRVWYYSYVTSDGTKRECRGCTDKRATEDMARSAESEAAQIRSGSIDPPALAYRRQEARPLSEHLDEYEADMRARGNTSHYARLHADRARRVVALVCGGKLADFDAPKTATKTERTAAGDARTQILHAARFADLSTSGVQDALATLRAVGRSLETLNHYRAAIRGFVIWGARISGSGMTRSRGLSGSTPRRTAGMTAGPWLSTSYGS